MSRRRYRPRSLAVAPGGVTAKATHRRPIRHSRWRRVIQMRELSSTVDDPAADDGEVRCDVGDLVLGTREVVALRNDEIRELPHLDATFLAFLIREPGDVLRPHPERRLAVEAVWGPGEPSHARRVSGDAARHRKPGV